MPLGTDPEEEATLAKLKEKEEEEEEETVGEDVGVLSFYQFAEHKTRPLRL